MKLFIAIAIVAIIAVIILATRGGGARVTAFTTTSASPGDVIWWVASPRRPVEATAFDASGRVLERLDLDG